MAKAKTAFVCNDCGADFPKWQGQCGECHAWNTLSEIRLSAPAAKASARAIARADRLCRNGGFRAATRGCRGGRFASLGSGFDEFDRVLGGGFVPGSSILIGGHPGAGKSTLLLQALCRVGFRVCRAVCHGRGVSRADCTARQSAWPADRSLQLMAETDVDAILAIC